MASLLNLMLEHGQNQVIRSWGSSSWLSLILATCILPFIYNLFSSHMSHLIDAVQRKVSIYFNRYESFYIYETEGMLRNDLYRFVGKYVRSVSANTSGARNVCSIQPSYSVYFSLEPFVVVNDSFDNRRVAWTRGSIEDKEAKEAKGRNKKRNYYGMKMSKQRGEDVTEVARRYVEHIVEWGIDQERVKKNPSIYSNAENQVYWSKSMPFRHPFTFETLALPSSQKEVILRDLKEFQAGKAFYQRVGKPWKRGYLLYGPPGTGKSSLIAAISNYMGYDIYDLDLTAVGSNAMLRQLLLGTLQRSIIVIEDIDCSVDLSKRKKRRKNKNVSKLSLSGVLNFCDGLWSGRGDERIFIFTTNHVENLDPALFRKGRMDLHLCLTYCRFEAFKILMWNYLEIREHELLPEIEGLIESALATPADVGEVLLSSRHDATAALRNVIELLKAKSEPSQDEKEDEEDDSEKQPWKGYYDEYEGEDDGQEDGNEDEDEEADENDEGGQEDGNEEEEADEDEDEVDDEDGSEYSSGGGSRGRGRGRGRGGRGRGRGWY